MLTFLFVNRPTFPKVRIYNAYPAVLVDFEFFPLKELQRLCNYEKRRANNGRFLSVIERLIYQRSYCGGKKKPARDVGATTTNEHQLVPMKIKSSKYI